MTFRSARPGRGARVAYWLWLLAPLAFSGCRPKAPALEPPEEILVTEGVDYIVPQDKVAVITYLWADSISITDVGISVDGSPVICANQTEHAASSTVLVTARGGSTIRVYGGLIEEADARCRGYLVDEGRVLVRCP